MGDIAHDERQMLGARALYAIHMRLENTVTRWNRGLRHEFDAFLVGCFGSGCR